MKAKVLAAALTSLALLPCSAARADHRSARWDDWYDGNVQIHLNVRGGEGTVVRAGARPRLEFEVEQDAYVLVYAIDTDGEVRLLFPRFWEDDGWVEGGSRVRLDDRRLAYPLDDWDAGAGVVYVQAVASPHPFDWDAMGCMERRGVAEWWSRGAPLRIDCDPLVGFNRVNQCIFADWEHAVFVADYTWFYVRDLCAYPRYLVVPAGDYCPGDYDPWLRVSVHLGWRLDHGWGHCRPIYQPHFVYRRWDSGSVATQPPRQERDVRIDRKRWVHDSRDKRATDPGRNDDRRRDRDETRPQNLVRLHELPVPTQRNDLPPAAAPTGDRSPSPDGNGTEIRRRDPEVAAGSGARGVLRAGFPRRGATPPSPEPGSEVRREREPSPRVVRAAEPRAPVSEARQVPGAVLGARVPASGQQPASPAHTSRERKEKSN